MSSRKSVSRGEGLLPSRCGERTPLRSVQNEMQHLSTPSRLKSKLLLSADVEKTTEGDAPLCDPEHHLQSPPTSKVIQINASTADMTSTETACGLGDITFKSFICPGGEVEVTGSSVCEEDSIILPNDQAMKTTTEDTVISDSIIVESCSDHREHPYYHPEMKDASLVDITACLWENSNNTPASGDLDDGRATQDVTWKSFVCDGGEVEVSDVTTRLHDETIPLPKAQLGEPLQDDSVNLTNLSDCSQLCQAEHADHPYWSSENDVHVISASSETTHDPENPADGLSDVTFKSFNCTGGMIEISDGTKLADETVPLPADQTATCSESCNYSINPSFLAWDQDGDDHLDHPYCNYPSTLRDSLTITQEPIPFSLDGVDEVKQMSSVVPDDQTDSQEGIGSFMSVSYEVEKSDGSQKTSPLPDDQAVSCQPLDDNSAPTSATQDQIEDRYEQPSSHMENNEIVVDTDPPAITTSLLSNTSVKALDDNSVKYCQIQETPKEDSVDSEDCALPSMHHRTESSDCILHAASAETSTPVDVQVEHVSQVQISSGPRETNEPKDSVLGSSGNGPNLCNSAEKPQEENFPECPSSALPFGLLSPDVRRASLAVSVVPDGQTDSQEGIGSPSFMSASNEVEKSDGSQKTSPLPDDQAVSCQPLDDNRAPTSATQDQIEDHYEPRSSHVENNEIMVDTDPPAITTSLLSNTSVKALDDNSVKYCQMQETSKESSDCTLLAASAETSTPVDVQVELVSQVQISSGPRETSEAKDSVLGSSGNVPNLCNPAEKPQVENFPECPSVPSALPFGLLSPAVRRASLAVLKAFKGPAFDQFLADDFTLEHEKSTVSPFNMDPAGLWAEYLESPMPRPLFNSTVLSCKLQPDPVTKPVEDVDAKLVPQSEAEKPALDIPFIPDGPLQQQLRQMAEFLFLASGKMGPAAPVLPPAAVAVQSAKAAPAESHGVCVGTTPVKWTDHSVNTSGQFERKRDFSVVDSCTLTDPLLWNVPPGSLECLPREELEQRLRSSMMIVEALVQQLAASRAGCPSAGPAPSDLREKIVQTDHTELSQTTMYRDLYLAALSRIDELELDGSSLQDLIHRMQDTRVTMTSLSCDTDTALSNMKQMGDAVSEDHQSLVSHYGQMKSLLEKSKKMQTTMMQKVKDALHQREDMRTQKEDAFAAKEAAFSVMEQLRTHCATEISELERMVGSQQELLAALHKTYPEQVALNQAYTEILNSASDVLSTTMEEQSSLMKELCTVRGLLHKTAPTLLKLNEKAAAALRERDEHLSARDQAVEEREQIEEELNQANMNLQTAGEQIGDLNLQVTILTSEMGVLRQKLTEREEERGQLERKVTELSATVSSTLASYTYLEQALGAETTKLQQSWTDIKLAKERGDELETSLGQSEQRVSELSQALAQSEEQLSQLQVLSQSQSVQIKQLQDVCTQLGGVREMNEFLQMENELTREQVSESEHMLKSNLQALRERNFQCEDLKGELGRLQHENRSLQEELETTKSRAGVTELELREKLEQACTDITLLHHTLRGLTNELHAALNEQKPEPLKDKDSRAVHNLERRHLCSSFVDSVMVALTSEKEEDATTETPPGPAPLDSPEPQCDTLFSETSAFTRIAAVTPRKNLTVELEDEQSSVAELFADLGGTVTELIGTLKLLRQRKDAQLEEMHNTISGLQVEQQAANNRHEAEVSELRTQLNRLNNLFEKANQTLQQKTQDEKTVAKLMAETQEAQEALNKYKTDSNELRKEVVELRRSLQQSKAESHFLQGELRKAGSQSANPAHLMEEKIQLLREVERLKLSLREAEQARTKLLERAKRHQMIHQTNQQKSENELQMLNHMINKVRETLLALPVIVKNCEQLQQLVEYIG